MTTLSPDFIPSRWLGATPDAPRDVVLPDADHLADRATLGAWFSSSWGVSAPVDPAAIVYESVRYKPGVRLTTVTRLGALRVTWRAFAADEVDTAWQKLIAQGIDSRDRTRIGSVIGVRFPVDHVLSGLGRIVPGQLGAAYVRRVIPDLADERMRLRSYSFTPTLMRYKPERHAVFHLAYSVRDAETGEKSRHRAIARVLPPGSALPQRLDTPFTPHLLAWDADNGISIESFVPGRTLTDALAGGDRDDLLRAVGGAIASLHEIPPTKDRALGRPKAHAPLWEPSIRSRVSALVAALADASDSVRARTTVHGDLHPGQILHDGTRWWLVDLDKCGTAPPERDLGDLIAALLELDAGARWDELYAPLGDGYQRAGGTTLVESAVRAWTAVAVIRRAEAPLRNLHPERHAIARNQIERAEDLGNA